MSATSARPQQAGRLASVMPSRGRKAGMSTRVAQWATDDSPWDLPDLVRFIRLVGVGGAGLAVCWYEMAGENRMHDQMKWLTGAVGFLLMAGFGMLMWLLAGIRAVHHGVFEVISVRRAEQAGGVAPALDDDDLPQSAALQSIDADPGYVLGATMTRVHRPDCTLVRGKHVERIAAAEVSARGLGRCGVCCP